MENPLTGLLEGFQVTGSLLWVGFALFLLFYSTVSGILIFHWRRYGMKNSVIVFAETLFLLVSGLFAYMAVIGLSLFSV